jgi:hypothetical protein
VALARGQGRIDWVDPGTRVSFSEVVAKAQDLGVGRDPMNLCWWLSANIPGELVQ